MQWLKVTEGESINATIDLSTIKSVPKHWTGQRSELCLGQGCPHCLAGLAKRWRYQARLLIDESPVNWEFGEQAMTDLKAVSHTSNFAHIIITRLGDSRNTRYQITEASPRPSYTAIAADNAAVLIKEGLWPPR